MIEGLKAYPEYRDYKLPWLEKLPTGWRALRAKGVFYSIDIRSQSGREELLTVSAANGVVPRRSTNVAMFMAKSYVGHKLCWPVPFDCLLVDDTSRLARNLADVLNLNDRIMLMVAGDGVEPPTRGFSVRCSTN